MRIDSLPPDRLAEVDRLLAAALDLAPEERARYLAELAGRDAEAAGWVTELLALAEAPEGRLEPGRAVAGAAAPLLDRVAAGEGRASEIVPAGSRVGAWRILSELGRGGMSVVYLAERADGAFAQKVALKFLLAGATSQETLRRFEQERQILATLRHPGIAHLLDGGVDASGRPYIVLEHVEGQPIDRWCDQRRLPIADRLDLFVTAARAVEHAHGHLVVHRDIKPSNLFITGAGEPKLLDFGIAKLLDPALAGDFLAPPTRTVARLLTPEYASPEQVAGRPVTTASDVYQLGLLLYELLTGRRAQRVEQGSAAEIERAITEVEPPRPSLVAGAAGSPSAAEVAAADARSTTPAALARSLAGDLDNIVAKALAKEPERRYAGVSELVADVLHFRAGEPIAARAPTLRYRVGKFVRRHRLGVAAAALIAALLFAGLAGTTWQAVAARRERDHARQAAARAERVTELLVGVFEASAPERAQGRTVSARELLERGTRRVERELTGEPLLRADLLDVIGRAYRSLGLYEAAQPLLAEALDLRRGNGAEPAEIAASLQHLGEIEDDRGDLDRATELYQQALTLRRKLHGEVHAEVAETLRHLGLIAFRRKDEATAERLFRQVLEQRQAVFGPDSTEVAQSLTDLGLLAISRDDNDGAEPLLLRALAMRRAALGDRHPQVAESLSLLGVLRHNQERYEEAETYYREAYELKRSVLGPSHPETLAELNNLATLLYSRERWAAAEPLMREVLTTSRELLGEHHPWVALYLSNLGGDLRLLGRPAEAEAYLSQALAVQEEVYGKENLKSAVSAYQLAAAQHEAGHDAEAERRVQQALRLFEAQLPAGDALIGHAALLLGEVLTTRGRLVEAEPLLLRGLAIRRQSYGEDDWRTASAKSVLGALRAAQGRRAEAEELLAAAVSRLRAEKPEHPYTRLAERRLAALHR